MNLERITSPLHPLYKQALELYQISFPFHEQREAFSQAAILHDDAYHFDLIYDAGTFVGLVLYWESLDYIYGNTAQKRCGIKASVVKYRHG